ncbi:MAG TPA: GspMb/PilO family protein [Vicinamibacterales bacterium]|jgi:Tfp pilus assembly protein PilO|nr:GspMb/PilO family protein [Vicinamibacterales bacterium]
MIPFKRVFDENRGLVIPVAAALVLNVIAYVAIVYPLGVRVRNAGRREETAASELLAAQRDDQASAAMLQGRDRTDTALKAFYKDVLPNSLASANRITYLRLAQLAEQHHLRYSHRSAEPETNPQGPLTRLRITTVLEGDYQNVRRFIYQLESGPDFIVIDSMTLNQDPEAGAPLQLSLSLSTFYQPEHGA